MIDNEVQPMDITSLIIYWADKGYITIEEQEDKKLFGSKKYFVLHKLKDLEKDAKNYEHNVFKALFDDTHPQGEKIIYAIPTLISKLSPEVITIKDKNGFFSNVNFSAKGITSCEFQNVIAFHIKNAFQRGLLFAVGDDLPNFRAIDEMTKIKEIVSDAKLKEKLDSLNFEITNELTNQLPNYTIKDKEDVFQLIQDVVLSLKEPWNEKNRETVKNQINDYFPFLKNRY
jgi:hypothetical protein